MSISNTTYQISGSGDGVTTVVSFPFKIFSANQLVVTLTNVSTGATTTLTLGTDYSVSINAVAEGGFVGFTVAPLSGYTWLIERQVAFTQSLTLATEGALPSLQITNQLDLMTMMIIQLQGGIGPSLPMAQTGYILQWNSSGQLVNAPMPASGATGAQGPQGIQGPQGASGSGTGDVLGPASNTTNYVPQWSGAKTLSNGLAVGTAANNLVQMTAAAKLPAVDGSLLTSVNVVSTNITGTLPTAHGGTGSTANANAASGVVVLDSSARLPAVDGSQLTNLPQTTAAFVPNNIQIFTASGTWIKPTGVSQVYVKVFGKGGAGYTGPGGGGGGGGYAEGPIAVVGNVNVTIGSPNSFAGSTTISASSGADANGSGPGAGGSGSGGSINLTGQAGMPAVYNSYSSLRVGGPGGQCPFGGVGGVGSYGVSAAGGTGAFPGGGGGGGCYYNPGTGGVSSNGGAGDAGCVIVYY